MPYELRKNGNAYMVRNKLTGHIFAKHSTLENAKKQLHLLESLYEIKPYSYEKAHAHGFDIYPSKVKDKKIDVWYGDKFIASIGNKNYDDYPTMMLKDPEYAEQRRILYHKRHTRNGIKEYLAKLILW